MRRAAGAGLALLLALAGGCARPPDPSPGGFSVPAFFEGASVSKGTVTVALVSTTAFTARFEGVRKGSSLVLDERFLFEDGPRLQRWRLTEVSPGVYRGTVETQGEGERLAPPVPVEGRATRDGAVLVYDGIAPGGGGTRLGFRHVMTARPDGTVSNHVTVSKFGLPVATSAVVFAKTAAALDAAPPP